MQIENVSGILIEKHVLTSVYLQREVNIDIYHPASLSVSEPISLLLINDGQDMKRLGLASILTNLYIEQELISPLICVAIHCGPERKMEYGVAGIPDFNGRGAKADLYTSFVLEELLPSVLTQFPVAFHTTGFAGFSLGALMALDIAWKHPKLFSRVGVFSGSLWWRTIDQISPEYDDQLHRIMHLQIRQGEHHPGMKFFFQCGNMDETKDRNKNGIIDSIDDTRDLIAELVKKGYDSVNDIRYLEIADGQHDVPTWGRAMPEFLKWGFGKQAGAGSR